MYCAKCQNDLSKCTCPDIDERLASLEKAPNFCFRKCLKGGKHYSRCKCKEPEWGISGNEIK